MAYQYRGTIRDVEEAPAPLRPQKLDGFDPSACGTYAGYRRHQKHGVPACRDCKDAQAAYTRDYYQKRGGRPVRRVDYPFDPSACGTYAGYMRHSRSSVAPCEACRQAQRGYIAARRAAKKVAA